MYVGKDNKKCNDGSFLNIFMLTLCHQVRYKDMIAIPCIIDGSHISMFSYTTSCTYVCQLVWLTYCLKVIEGLMQDVWVSTYKQTDCSWHPIFRTIRLQQRDHWFRYPSDLFYNFLQLRLWLCIGVFWKMIFWVSYMQIHVLMPVMIRDNEILDSDSDVPTTSVHKQLWPCAIVFSSDNETSTEEEALMIKQVTCGIKLMKNQAMSLSSDPQVWI